MKWLDEFILHRVSMATAITWMMNQILTYMNKGFCALPFSIHLKKLGLRAPGWLGSGLMFGFAKKTPLVVGLVILEIH